MSESGGAGLPDPGILFRARDSIYASDLVLAAAVHLDLFSRLETRVMDRRGICSALGIQDRPADVMMTLFTAMGLVRRRGEGFVLTPLSGTFLTRGSRRSLLPYFASLGTRSVCRSMVNVLRTGEPESWADGSRQEWVSAMEDAEFAGSFTAAMDSRGAYFAPLLAKCLNCRDRTRLLDIGGGSGIYACHLVREFPHLEASILEKPPADAVAGGFVGKMGLSDQIGIVAGDMFDEIPSGYDVHLLSNVLHDWDQENVERVLAGSFQALLPGGSIAIHDTHINAAKTGPLEVAEYSVLLMYSTEGKCYSVSEMNGLLKATGFVEIEYVPIKCHRSLIMARKR
ncbi:MAG: methyltransferase [Candidatus Aminicenantes bacterium]|nr:methyltransferase [Candidatus Aminicenantes bacterium]